jgi:hypothetical protein
MGLYNEGLFRSTHRLNKYAKDEGSPTIYARGAKPSFPHANRCPRNVAVSAGAGLQIVNPVGTGMRALFVEDDGRNFAFNKERLGRNSPQEKIRQGSTG